MAAGEGKIDERRFGKEIEFKVQRFDPDRDERPYFKSYRLVLERGMTVLDALIKIKETQDPTLSYRTSCRMGICGSCAMYVNGKPVLACQTQVIDLNSSVVVVRPLPNYPIIRDLVPDLGDLFDKHQYILPHILREDQEKNDRPEGEYLQTPEELDRYIQFAYCIKCGACLAACPTCSTDTEFLGPQALTQAYRYLPLRGMALPFRRGVFRCLSQGCRPGFRHSAAERIYSRSPDRCCPDP